MKHKTRVCLLLLALAPALAAATTVYRWVDAQGVVHYSDQPHPGAKKVETGSLTILNFKTPPPTSGMSAATSPPSSETGSAPSYQVKILAPSPGTTLWPVNYKIHVQVKVTPSLRAPSLLQYQYDGEDFGKPTARTEFEMHKVYRGTHTLTVTVVGPHGQSEGQGSSTFYVHQHSILHPGRRPPPKNNGGGGGG